MGSIVVPALKLHGSQSLEAYAPERVKTSTEFKKRKISI
jgi:hypothetical protein